MSFALGSGPNDTDSEPLKTRIEETQTCLYFRFGRTVRLLNRHYDKVLRPIGLRVAQFNILAALAQSGPISVTKLANLIGIERSALARNLKSIARRRWVRLYEGEDRRMLVAEITPAGTNKLTRALPNWKTAQSELVAGLGSAQTTRLLEQLSKIRQILINQN